MTYLRLSLRYLLTTILIIILSFALFFIIKEVLAWTNPTQAPPGGSGLITVSGGNVGIGTTSPVANLSVESASDIRTTPNFVIKNTNSNVGATGFELLTGAQYPAQRNWAIINGYDVLGGLSFRQSNNNTNLAAATTGTTRMMIDNNGNVGIGTTGPAFPLHVLRNTGASYAATIDNAASAGSSYGLLVRAGGNSVDIPFVVRDLTGNTDLFKIRGDGNVGIGTTSPGSKLEIKQNSGSGFLVLKDTNTTPNYRNIYLYANTSLMAFDNGSNIANLTAAGLWADASDISYKENISSLDYGLSTILQIQPKRYNMKADGSKQIGFIAQEIEPIVPEVVSGTDGNKSIVYGHLIPILVNAIKELNQKINALTQGTARFAHLVADRLTIGSSEKPTGITIFDKETRDPYCLEIVNGVVKSNKGECQ